MSRMDNRYAFLNSKREPKKDALPSEHLEQVDFVSWFRKTFPKFEIFAIPNGGHRSRKVAAELKAEGVRPGVPDLFCPDLNLFIEMKRQKKSRLSAEQKNMIEHLFECGFDVLVCYGFEDARSKLEQFMIESLKE